MSCKSAKFDDDSGRYECGVSGDGCVYLIPDSKQCAKDYGEGPDSVEIDNTEYTKRIPNTFDGRKSVSRSLAFEEIELSEEDLEWIFNGGCVVYFDGEYDNFITMKKDWC